ncbi:MAG TPA: hypothetical protein VM240_09575 [Verrucomicrobiae bacterium]|nr:hypothetical protein [Verrucomicrobiae bacterium]
MARTAGKKQAPAKVEEDDDVEGWDDAVVEADGKEAEADLRLRDWRDVERYREMKELRGLVDTDDGLEEIFHVPLRQRIDAKGKGKAKVAPAKAAVAPPAVPAKPGKPVPAAPAKARPEAAAKPAKATKPDKAAPAKPVASSAKVRTEKAQVKAAPAKKAPKAKLSAKAKRK